MKTIDFECIDSTNDYAKEHAAEGDMIVTAKRQTAGRGSKNRSFDSGEGGLYITKLEHYDDFPASDVFRIMLDSSLAVCHTLEDFGLSAKIKWPNDVYCNGKKICGILIENTFRGNKIAQSVVGIGLNVNNELPESLKEIAITMSEAKGEKLNVEEVRGRLVFHLKESWEASEYKKYIFFFGKEIDLLQNGNISTVTALDVDDTGRLVINDGGNVRTVTAGEVSLRFREEK